jgi:hypothetical protein
LSDGGGPAGFCKPTANQRQTKRKTKANQLQNKLPPTQANRRASHRVLPQRVLTVRTSLRVAELARVQRSGILVNPVTLTRKLEHAVLGQKSQDHPPARKDANHPGFHGFLEVVGQKSPVLLAPYFRDGPLHCRSGSSCGENKKRTRFTPRGPRRETSDAELATNPYPVAAVMAR